MKEIKAPFPDESSPRNLKEPTLIVGIGASAGGVQALQDFFRKVPENSNCTYVVILHLSPDHDSALAAVLRGAAAIPVTIVTEKTKVLPNHVYVISPNSHLTMMDGHLIVSENLTTEDRRAPVDIFFRTLAESHGERAVSVVLSGTGANGSMGLRRIKELGGAAFVQDPNQAEFGEMPRHSIKTQMVDAILPVADIPDKIISYKEGLEVVKVKEELENRPEDQQQALRIIFNELRMRTGHDFSKYKRPTLLRRIERRINVVSLPNLPAYAALLKESPDEYAALLKDFLISVTNFFRDAKAFELLETEVLPSIIKKKNKEKQLRIWVAGCATGEEAYSIAMLVADQLPSSAEGFKVQIFATDIDEAAVAVARDGFYTLNDAADVSPDRLRRFFNKEGGGYRVRREIREMVLFATHNFLKDPPFSRLDLVSCRNVLIYLNQEAKERVMETFHFALNPGGFLFLGSSESVDGANDLYTAYHREYHLFQTRQVNMRSYPIPESVPKFTLKQVEGLQKLEEKESHSQERISFGELHQRLLEEYSPPSVVVNEDYEIMHMSETVGKYFEIPGGEPTKNLLKVIRPEIKFELRSALIKAVQRKALVEVRDLKLKVKDQMQSITIHVRPVFRDEASKGFMLVVFDALPLDETDIQPITVSPDEPIAKHLEEEVIKLKTQLRNSGEQYELQAEELKASNEELQAINEELRSAAEELETSKEELQSINEELRTVNQELKIKIEETSLASNNLQNLINSADVGTIFLNRNLQIKLFTPAVGQLFNLRPSDYGRPLTDITNNIEYTGLIRDAEMVLEQLTTVTREVNTKDNRWFLIRLLPYRTQEERIDGVVLTFFDITVIRHAEEALKESQARFRTLTDAVPQLIWATDQSGKANYFNQRWFEYSGLSYEQSVGSGWFTIIHSDDRPGAERKWERALKAGRSFDGQFRLRNSSGIYSWHLVRNVPRKDVDEKVIGWFGSATDIQNLKKAEELQRNVADRLQLALQAGHLGSYEFDFKTGIVKSTAQHKLNYGYKEDEDFTFEDLKKITIPEDLHLIEPAIARHSKTQKTYSTEYRIRLGNDTIRWIKSVGRFLHENNEPVGMVGISLDVTETKLFTEELGKQVNERTVELKRSNEDLIQFAHVASHDLKEPVRKIRTFTGRLIEEFGSVIPEKGNLYLEKIQKATSRMTSMIEGVLNYSMHGILEESFSLVDLNKTIRQIESDLDLLITQKNASIIKSDLPVVRANAILMYQLFYNLINNSLKFSKLDQAPVISISYVAAIHNNRNYVKIELSDNGIGFENEFAQKIFDTFTRLHPKDDYEGTGLGLALCKKIIDRHHGFIGASGEPDKGAVFTILLPT